jgi:hypothetical protein
MSCLLTYGAPSAWADSQDDHFMQQLNAYGVRVTSDEGTAAAIEAGKFACDLKRQGLRDYDVNNELEDKYPRNSSSIIATTAAVALLVYCPEYLHF